MLALMLMLVAETPQPTLCVQVDRRAEVDSASLVAAISARIARKQLRVRSCEGDGPSTWRLTLSRVNPVSVSLELSGPEVQAQRTITIDGMAPEEVVQFISATAAEAVRPSLEKLLGAETSGDDLVATLEANAPKCVEQTCPEPRVEVRRVEVPIEPAPAFDLSLGPILGIDELRAPSIFLELGGGFASGLFFAGLHLGLEWLPPASEADIRLRVWEIEASVDAGVRLAIVRIGLRLQGRLAIADPSGAPTIPDGLQFFWNGGFGLFSNVAVWTTGVSQLRVLLRGWFWPQPNRFLVEGEPVLTQSHLELLLGIEIAFGKTFSNQSLADQSID